MHLEMMGGKQNSASLIYNNEISLSSINTLAYYSVCKDYTLIREMPTGNRFAILFPLFLQFLSNKRLSSCSLWSINIFVT